MKFPCPTCGSPVDKGMAICPSCGEDIPSQPGTATDPETTEADALANDPAAPQLQPITVAQRRRPGADTRIYFGALIGALVLTGLIWIISTPKEVKGPPKGNTTAAATQGMPEGHPPTGPSEAPQMSPEEQEHMRELASRVDGIRTEQEANPANDSLRLLLANLYYDLQRHADALPLYQDYLKRHPDNPDARTDLAFAMANLNNVPGAIDELMKVVKAHPKHQNAPYNLAMMYVARRNKDSVLYWLERVVEIDSTSQQGRNALEIVASLKSGHSPMDEHDHPVNE